MSGIYLHGLVILDTANVVVRDNIFSHSELRKYVTNNRTEQPIPGVSEWSWDYVNREFCDTKENIQKIAQRWIDENLSTHEQLIAWVDRNWEGLTADIERECYMWGLISLKATHENILFGKFLDAYRKWVEAYRQWEDAYKQRAEVCKQCVEAEKKAEKQFAEAEKQFAEGDKQWVEANKQWVEARKQRACAYQQLAKAEEQREEIYKQGADNQWKIKVMKPVFLELLQKYPCRVWQN